MSNDLISRQAALALAKDISVPTKDGSIYRHRCIDPDAIREVPSAQQKGKWIYLNGLDAFECSVCGRQMVRNIFDYCPWCGAEMTKGEEDE